MVIPDQAPLTPVQVGVLAQRVEDLLMRVNDPVDKPASGEVLAALAALRRIVEQAKRAH